ncbi:Hypothetical predicted protein [Lecanosticta acicola]|uniref:Nuclear pore complex protein Nup85 n=1 Tax=Lecanosticta acicola TaxID=111012 RepID=A0AAI8W1G2_9PEZI|nr:Hypothetical predicted protein [Lecanosticta acicola]
MSFSNFLPSTPKARSIRHPPSTTPKEPPPTHLTNKSHTPAGYPHSQFGSSFAPSNNTFLGKSNGYGMPDEAYSDEDAEGELDDELAADLPPLPLQSSMLKSSILQPSPRGLKRSHNGEPRANSDMAGIARGMLSKTKAPKLHESDEIISQNERLLAEIDAKVQQNPRQTDHILTESVAQLTKLWVKECDSTTAPGGVGPSSNDAFANANYIASLLLQLHHPHTHKPGKAQPRASALGGRPTHAVTLPRALLDWLETYHNPFPDDFDDISSFDPAPSHSETYWDCVFASVLRGKVPRAIDLLQNAGWEHAYTSLQDYGDEKLTGYRGDHVATAREAAQAAVKALGTCPGTTINNWDVKGLEWRMFRDRIQGASDALDAYSGNEGSHLTQSRNMFESKPKDASKSAKANSKVPWSVYENLKLLYGLLLGSVDDILLVTQDWLEGSLYLTIWWDGFDDEPAPESLNRSSMRYSIQKPRAVDVNPLQAYRNRLADAFNMVTSDIEDPAFAVNTMELLQTCLANVLEDNARIVVEVLRSWSLSIAVCVVEIAALGQWLSLTRPRSRDGLLDQGFSREDLLVLSAGPTNPAEADAVDRDDMLSTYAELLAKKPTIDGKEGWEFAVAVLNRLDQASDGQRQISELLDTIDLEDEARVDKVLSVCDAFFLTEQRRSIAERFADSLGERHESYGAALIYYARAQATAKLKDTVVFLTGLCLVHSVAMPVRQLLDAKLESLLSKDRQALKDLASSDAQAASTLSSHLSGFATLRKFYDLRDQDVYLAQGLTMHHPLKPLERRRQAASALFAVITSAADCIAGGLYDPEVESVVSPEGILALFGEALPLLGHDERIFTQDQVFALLAVVEDFINSPSRISENADSLLKASLNAYNDSTSTASGILKKSASSMSESSWDMMASRSLIIQSEGLGKNARIERAWDWRQGLLGMGGADADSNTVLNLIRAALIREVAAGWGGRLNW